MTTNKTNFQPVKVSMSWGFEPVGEQIVDTCLLFSGGINIFFLGNTVQKNIEDKKQNGES